ncbi:nitrate assimilation regulatory protein nira [Ophiostoma piceae UAMH 11346]|uniref:Nitrate assimilation regulatory protein nira n=1 Tax=Ophiostoma piceae (strain UAMH 11346) TaxID=1262450 RepID=S3BXH8_OPHP1|nr:nitrate assimilation regulatory protein nira [Ophiostoma piceae UAMH 11346]
MTTNPSHSSGNGSRPFRPLLPVTYPPTPIYLQPQSQSHPSQKHPVPIQQRPPHIQSHFTTANTQNAPTLTQRRRRDTSSIACNMCRTKKTACDRIRPSCALCIERGGKCVYRTNYRTNDTPPDATMQSQLMVLQTKVQSQNELLQTLISLPQGDALSLLAQLRQTYSPAATLDSLNGSMHAQMRPSDYRAAHTISPATSHIEFELSAQHRFVYNKIEPVENVSIQALLEPGMDGGYRLAKTDTLMHGTPYLSPPSLTSSPDSSNLSNSSSNPKSPDSTSTSALSYVDDRLHRLDIAYWTSVPIANSMAATVLSYYLENDHSLYNIFDPDLFLDSLVERGAYCSSFLVNAILFVGCQAYTAKDRSAAPLVHLFFTQAEILWRGRSQSLSLDLVATPADFSLICGCEILAMGSYFYGRDTLAHEALSEGRRRAQFLGLLGITPDEQAKHHRADPKWVRMASHVAWGVYSWLSAHCFYYNSEPIQYPPALPPSSITEFPSICQFWTITQEVAVVYLAADRDRTQPPPLAFAEEKYQKLLAWSDVQPPRDVTLQALLLQCWFHCTVIHIFRPFVDTDDVESKPLGSFAAADGSPATVFDASVQQLKHLVYTYLSNVPRIPLSGFFNAAFVHVGHAMVKDYSKLKSKENSDQIRLYFYLCMRAWADLYVCFPTIAEFTQAFLSMAMEAGIVTGAEAQSNMARLKHKGRHHADKGNKPKGVTSLIQLDLSLSNPEEASVTSLARRFNELATFSELTNGGDYIVGDS